MEFADYYEHVWTLLSSSSELKFTFEFEDPIRQAVQDLLDQHFYDNELLDEEQYAAST